MQFGRVPVEFTETQVLASLCRDSFYHFMREFWEVVVPETPVWNWHIRYLCDELQRMAERVFRGLPKEYDLVVNISPGSTKSTIVSIMFPAWLWTRMPSCRVISASYAHSLATELSRKSRDVIKSEKYQQTFPGVQIREDQDAKGFFVNTRGGDRYAFGVGGAVTGKHGHFLIVDDPLDPNRAFSDAELKAANRWMEETLPSRKVDKSIVPTILIMQRLHENDPTGARLEKADRVPVRHICLPAELTDNVKPSFLRDFYVNGLMDPDRLGYDVLAEAEVNGQFSYASQYLQTPIPRGGAMFDPDKIQVDAPPRFFVKIARFWDKAGTAGGGAFTAGVKIGVDVQGKYWILDVVRGQWDSYTREDMIRRTAEMDGRQVHVGVEQEPGSGGKDSALATVRRLAGFVARAVRVGKGDGDKEARADPFSAQVNGGNVWMVKAPWNATYLDELRFFPRSKYKDQVDASSGAFNMIAGGRRTLGGGRLLRRPVDVPLQPELTRAQKKELRNREKALK